MLFCPAKIALPEVEPHLGRVHVERSHELARRHVVPAEDHVHEAGDSVGRIGVAVVLDALDQGAGAVAHAGDGDPDLVAHLIMSS